MQQKLIETLATQKNEGNEMVMGWAHIKKGCQVDARWEKEVGMAQNNLEKDCSKKSWCQLICHRVRPKIKGGTGLDHLEEYCGGLMHHMA